jgi:hypothetical protein
VRGLGALHPGVKTFAPGRRRAGSFTPGCKGLRIVRVQRRLKILHNIMLLILSYIIKIVK